MIPISAEKLNLKKATLVTLQSIRRPFWNVWRDIADYLLPVKSQWLQSDTERRSSSKDLTNPMILDGTGTLAAETLAAGLMNGIASPARPWFKLGLVGFGDDLSRPARIWLDEVEYRMRYVISESNFYNALAVFFSDLVFFANTAMAIYEDDDKVIHCQNYTIGEYYFDLDNRGRVCHFARQFSWTVLQVVKEFGLDNVSDRVKRLYKEGKILETVKLTHMIEPNIGILPSAFEYVEYYWEDSETDRVLREKGFSEKFTLIARWEVSGNDVYGVGPANNALPDIKQLQHETRKKAQAMDKMVSPPLLADVMLEGKPLGLLPNGVSFVPRLDANNGVRPLYTVNPPIGEMSQDIMAVQQRIQMAFYNFLFNKVTTLPTVRSAKEIEAIEGEKLTLLGRVLERFENEALDPAINRIFSIMARKGMFPPAPAELQNRDLQIRYVSLISAAQSAAGTASTERWLQFGGSLVAVWPEIREIPDIVDVFTRYGKDLGVPASSIRDRDSINQTLQQRSEDAQRANAVQQGTDLSGAARNLAAADVGGGQNALQTLLQG